MISSRVGCAIWTQRSFCDCLCSLKPSGRVRADHLETKTWRSCTNNKMPHAVSVFLFVSTWFKRQGLHFCIACFQVWYVRSCNVIFWLGWGPTKALDVDLYTDFTFCCPLPLFTASYKATQRTDCVYFLTTYRDSCEMFGMFGLFESLKSIKIPKISLALLTSFDFEIWRSHLKRLNLSTAAELLAVAKAKQQLEKDWQVDASRLDVGVYP